MVYAGADRSQALAAAHGTNRSNLAVGVHVHGGRDRRRHRALPPDLHADHRPERAGTAAVRRPVAPAGADPRDRGRSSSWPAISAGSRSRSNGELEVTARGAAIVESSNDSIISWTPSGIITTWNSRSEQMYGYPAEEAIGRDMSLIVPPERIAEVGLLHEQVLRGEPVEPVETQKVRSDGTPRRRLGDRSPRSGIGPGRWSGSRPSDATSAESKRAVEALRSSEARKGAILASALDAIITMNSEGRIDEFNPAAERTFGFAAADVIGRRLSEVIIPPEQRDAHDEGLERFLATGEARLFGRCTELTAMRADGTLFPAEVTINGVDVPGAPVVHRVHPRRHRSEGGRGRAAVAGGPSPPVPTAREPGPAGRRRRPRLQQPAGRHPQLRHLRRRGGARRRRRAVRRRADPVRVRTGPRG